MFHGHRHHHGGYGFCCCGPRGHFGVRRFLSKEERIEELKQYVENLRKEIVEAEKRIKSLEESDKDDYSCCCCCM